MAIQEDHAMLLEAAAAGLEGIQHLVHFLSPSPPPPPDQKNSDLSEVTNFTVSRFKHMISILNRTGHARFRRGPPTAPSPTPTPATTTPPASSGSDDSQTPSTPPPQKSKPLAVEIPTVSQNSNATTSFLSSITGGCAGDGSVSNGKQFSGQFPTAGKPPLPPPAAKRKKCHEEHGSSAAAARASKTSNSIGSSSSTSHCHCHKKRKNMFRKTVRVPAISSKMSEIPQDEFSWRKYGQKPIKASPFPRGYYRCTIVKGCPAKKKVEQAKDDPTMLIVTYEFEHNHSCTPATVVGVSC